MPAHQSGGQTGKHGAPSDVAATAPPSDVVAPSDDSEARAAHDCFHESQMKAYCAMHAAHNVVGSDGDDHLNLESFVDAAVEGGETRGRASEGWWGADEFYRCFSSSKLYDHEQIVVGKTWLNNCDHLVEFLKCVLPQVRGFIIHQPGHWVALRMQTHGDGDEVVFQMVDSQESKLGDVYTLVQVSFLILPFNQ